MHSTRRIRRGCCQRPGASRLTRISSHFRKDADRDIPPGHSSIEAGESEYLNLQQQGSGNVLFVTLAPPRNNRLTSVAGLCSTKLLQETPAYGVIGGLAGVNELSSKTNRLPLEHVPSTIHPNLVFAFPK